MVSRRDIVMWLVGPVLLVGAVIALLMAVTLLAASTDGSGSAVTRIPASLDGVEIGMSKEQIRSRLGPPSGRENGCWVYTAGRLSSARETVLVCFDGDRARSVDVLIYRPYAD